MLNQVSLYYLGLPVQLSKALDDFRRRFDPKYGVNEAHATLVAPFPKTLMTDDLSSYFHDLLATYKIKSLVAEGYYITSHGYLFYTFARESAAWLQELYDSLHEHPNLAARKEKHRPFLPHITLGKFENDKAVPEIVVNELLTLCKPNTLLFDRVRLYAILSEPKKRKHVRDYRASGAN